MFRVKLFLSGLICVSLFSACSWLNFSRTKKIAPDELYYVFKYDDATMVSTTGFMDKTGKIVVGPWQSFEWNGKKYGATESKTAFRILPFIERMAGICFYEENVQTLPGAGKCGFIDKNGKLVIEPKYKQIGYFSEGLAVVSEDGSKFGYIDQTGKQIIEPKFGSKAPFNNGLAATLDGYIDKTGKFAFEQKYKYLKNFGDGHSIVAREFGINQMIIIDKNGKEIKTIETESAGNTDYYYRNTFNNQFYGDYAVEDSMPSFNEGLMMTSHYLSKANPIGYVNTKGELEIKLDPILVGQIRPFSEGFAPIGWEIKDKDKLSSILGSEATKDVYDWTFIDRKGNVKVNLDDTFQDARPFAEGLAAVKPRKSDGRWGFINTEFKIVIPACFNKVNDFRAGLASVMVVDYANEKKGCEQYYQGSGSAQNIYIDKAGNIVKPQW